MANLQLTWPNVITFIFPHFWDSAVPFTQWFTYFWLYCFILWHFLSWVLVRLSFPGRMVTMLLTSWELRNCLWTALKTGFSFARDCSVLIEKMWETRAIWVELGNVNKYFLQFNFSNIQFLMWQTRWKQHLLRSYSCAKVPIRHLTLHFKLLLNILKYYLLLRIQILIKWGGAPIMQFWKRWFQMKMFYLN